MRRFILYIVVFVCGLTGLYALYYIRCSHATRLPQADIYVWGDSRMYWGLDVEHLADLTGKCICSTQHEGASVYDMLTFVNRVPANSTCIIGFSECVLYRDHESDYNRSGLNLWSAGQLLKTGYSLKDVYGISKLNKWVSQKIVVDPHAYFEPADTVCTPEPMPGWVTMYNKDYPYYEAKAACYDLAIETLRKKNCSVILLDFAGYKEVEDMAAGTPNRLRTEALVEQLVNKYNLTKSEMVLHSDSLLFYDLSHLNSMGAYQVADDMANKLQGGQYIRIVVEDK